VNILNPITLTDLANFLYNIFSAYNPYIFFAITMMFASHALVLTRRLLVGVKQ